MFRVVCRILIMAFVLTGLVLVRPAFAQENTVADQLRSLAQAAHGGAEAAEHNNSAEMKASYSEIHEDWETFEAQVRTRDAAGYIELEAALDGVKDALAATPANTVAIAQAYDKLQAEANEIASRLAAYPAPAANTSRLAAYPAPVTGATAIAERLHALELKAREGAEALGKNDLAKARAVYAEIHTDWVQFEDGVRESDATGYVELEAMMDGVKDGLAADKVDSTAVQQMFLNLAFEAKEHGERIASGQASAKPAAASSPAAVQHALEEASIALKQGDMVKASTELNEAITAWPAIEGAIATRSQDDYRAIEGDLGRASAALKAQPVDVSSASVALDRLRQRMANYTVAPQAYTAFDAAAIILREGLEALLVIVALLAFLRRSGNENKRGWIWAGGGLGVLASIVVGFIFQAIFNQASMGQNRELMEGIVGLVAAGLLFYVSYWLHSKASLHSWKRYINDQTTRALASGSMVSLALLAFLAVFREGAETVVFYIGMAPTISMNDLILGMGLGVAALVVAAVLMLIAGVKLPLRLFFTVAGLLVYYLGFKFVGTGIHALQVAGKVGVSPISWLSEVPFFGIFPTWETLIPQIVLLIAAVGAMTYLNIKDRRARTTSTGSSTPTAAATA